MFISGLYAFTAQNLGGLGLRVRGLGLRGRV